MRWLSVALVVLAVLTAKDAYAARWLRLGRNQWDVTYIDVDSERSEGAYRLVWSLTVFYQPRSIHGHAYRSEKILSYIDCARRQIAARSAIYYARAGGRGDVVDRYDDMDLEFGPVSPGSFGAVLINRECQ